MTDIDLDIDLSRGGFQLRVKYRLPAQGVSVLLGPSGSGKSTVLRLIAGLERPDSGRITRGETAWFDARRGVVLPPQRRRIGFVFQDYALFAHLNVEENVAYGLPRALRGAQRKQAVAHWLERLHLTAYARRYPHQLSGGQRQRVALARALAPDPDVLLLDEPFSAVDATLRRHLREQLAEAIAGVERPVLMVSHDLDDARYLADRIGVMVDGRLHRSGETQAVFADPGSREVAQVLGWQNFLPVRRLAGRDVSGEWGSLQLEREAPIDTVWLGMRAEQVRFASPVQSGLEARVVRIVELGAVRALHCVLADGTPVHVHRPWNEPVPGPGQSVRLFLPPASLLPMPDTLSQAAIERAGRVSADALARPELDSRPHLSI